jgi:hypothetical protein
MVSCIFCTCFIIPAIFGMPFMVVLSSELRGDPVNSKKYIPFLRESQFLDILDKSS